MMKKVYNTTDIRRMRLHNQLLMESTCKTPEEVVAYMGAMQAQAFDMAKWAIGVRLPGSTNRCVEEAICEGRIVRTHVLRPTWHFVVAEDVYWMLELTAPRIKPMYLGYVKGRGLDQSYIDQHFGRLEQMLEQESCLTRQEIIARFAAEGHEMESGHVNLLLSYGELEGIIGSGPLKQNKHSYCLLQKLIPKPAPISNEEAIERLTRRFFMSHSPATLEDFVWWSGLRVTDARRGLEMIRQDVISEEINGRTFWMKRDIVVPTTEDSALLLPPFDEFVVSYKDRSEIIEEKHHGKVMTKTGIFSPTIMYNGEIVGSWKKVTKKGAPEVELSFFKKVSQSFRKLYDPAIESVRSFYR